MRVFGAVALLAAMIIVGYSATSLFMSAFTSSVEPWQQYLAGIGTAAVVAWEATALWLIGRAWCRGYKPVAVMSTAMLVAAMMVTLAWEGRIVIGGRADKFASREVGVSKLKGIEDDLTWLRKRRDSVTNRKDLEWITARIEQRERDRDTAVAVKETMPEASAASRLLGGTESAWQDFLTVLPLFFWTLARVNAVPLAMVAFVGWPRKPESSSGIIVPPMSTSAVLSQPEAFAPPSEPETVPVSPPETKPSPKKEAETVTQKYPVLVDASFKKKQTFPKSIAKFRKQYLRDAPGANSDGTARHKVKGSDLWAFYNELPGESEVKSQSGFGKKLAKLGVKRENHVSGVFYTGVVLDKGIREEVA